MRAAYDLNDSFHRDARAFRNRLIIISLISIATSGLLVLLQWRLPSATIIQRPTGASNESAWALMLLVMVFGSVGALVSAIPAMASMPRVKSPFNFPLQQALMKVFVGSLTALVGVIATGSAGVTNGFASLEALVGVAVVFGAAQQAVTQYLDKRATQIISSKPSSTAS
ncbi:MAG TPA: hypothetical protein VGG09_13210 [Acidimicrobiales bacterium]